MDIYYNSKKCNDLIENNIHRIQCTCTRRKGRDILQSHIRKGVGILVFPNGKKYLFYSNNLHKKTIEVIKDIIFPLYQDCWENDARTSLLNGEMIAYFLATDRYYKLAHFILAHLNKHETYNVLGVDYLVKEQRKLNPIPKRDGIRFVDKCNAKFDW